MKIYEGKRNEINNYKTYPTELFHLAFLQGDDACVFKDTLTLHYRWNIFENLVCKLIIQNLNELFHRNNDINRNRITTNQLEMRQRWFSSCPFCLAQSLDIPASLWPVDIGREQAAVVATAVAAPLYLGQGYAGVLFTAIAPEGTCLLLHQIFSDFCQPLHRVLLLSDKLMKWFSSPG